MRRVLLYFALSCFVVLSFFLYSSASQGFSLEGIQSESVPKERWHVDEITQEQLALLERSFSYLGKGCQSYAFVDTEQEIVLKFFKEKHLKVNPLLSSLPSVLGLKTWQEKEEKRKNLQREVLFDGFCLAYRLLKEECGLLYLHLYPEPLSCATTLTDPLGRQHVVDLSSIAFILQKKGEPFLPYLERLLQKEQLQEAEALLENLLLLLERQFAKGVIDRDPALLQNIAVGEGNIPFFIDLGQFSKRQEGDSLERELERKLKPLLRFLLKNERSLHQVLEQKIYSSTGRLSSKTCLVQ